MLLWIDKKIINMLADIGLGIIIAVWTSWHFAVEPSFALIIFGIFFSLLPDFDFLLAVFLQNANKHNEIGRHRELSHFPILYGVLGFFVFLFWGKTFGTLFAFCILLHFLHDSVGIGWGVKWLWPFSDRAYKFFSTQTGERAFQVASWNKVELDEVERKYGDPNWIRNFYFRPTLISVSEFFVFLLGLVFVAIFWYK